MSTKVEISKRLVLINSASSVATRVVNVSVLVWLHQYLLRRISTEEYSLYPVLMAVMVFVPMLTVILTSGLGRYIVEAYAKGDERRVTQIVSTMFPLLLGAGIILLPLGWTFAWYVDRVLTITPDRVWDARIMLGLLMFSAAIRLPLAPFGVGMYVRQKFVLSNFIGLCIQILRISLLFILLFGISTRVLWVVVASVSADLFSLFVNVTISRCLVPALKFQPSHIRWAVAKKITSFGGWHLLGTIGENIRLAADPIILNKLATPLDITCFHLGSMPMRQIQGMSSAVKRPLGPQLVAMHVSGDKRRLGNTYLRGNRYALWATLILTLPLMIYSREIINLWVGSKFTTAATVMVLVLSQYPFMYSNMMMGNIAIATGNMRSAALRGFTLKIANLLLTLYLVGSLGMGAVGSALGTFLTTTFVYSIVAVPLGLRLSNVRFNKWLRETIWLGCLPGVLGAVIWIILKAIVAPSTWASLGFCFFTGLVGYMATLMIFCLTEYDRKNLKRLLAAVYSRNP